MTLHCVVETWHPLKGEHVLGCEDERCRGCAPRPAEPPLLVCTPCRLRTEDHLTELPALRVDLLTPTRPRAGGGPSLEDAVRDRTPTTLAEVRSPASDAALSERHDLRDLVLKWVRYLIDHHGTPAWDVRTGAYRYILEHYRLLLADVDQAATFVEQLDDALRRARRRAYPSGPPGQALGECPTCGVMVRAEGLGPATCRGCGATRSIDEWQQVLAGDLSGEVAAIGPDIAAWLSARHAREVTPSTVRQWASRGALVDRRPPLLGRERVTVRRLGTDDYARALYSVADARRIGLGLYGAPKASLGV
ncbi:hypothetical protein [Kineosporia succinea]|uniref:Uncharacterized protein n=1 Tax=Kineosporia succinea TaxID=84632 RepID=A0ABT9P663_9ACTN|nr:hypothetical protein [Kineosporia succinea]MDP9828061.1 hypothetical protein [Kineosporia succinea]